MRLPHLLIALCTAVAALCLFVGPVSAQVVVGLHIDYEGDMGPAVQGEIEDELVDIFETSRLYHWLPPEQGVHRLDRELQDCRDETCLRDIGQQLGARVGLVIAFEEESHIYDWTVDFYDLLSGDLLITDEGSCELCGRAEIVEQFRSTIVSNLVILDVTDDEPQDLEESPDIESTRVRITTLPDDTRIFIDDQLSGEGETVVELSEGRYEVRFSHEAHPATRKTLIIDDESAPELVLRVHLESTDGTPAQAIDRHHQQGVVDRMGTGRKITGWSAIGAGFALGATSAILASRHGQPNCADDVALHNCPEVYNTSTAATTTSIFAGLSLATGVFLIAWPRLSGAETAAPMEAGLNITPEINRRFSGITLRGRF